LGSIISNNLKCGVCKEDIDLFQITSFVVTGDKVYPICDDTECQEGVISDGE